MRKMNRIKWQMGVCSVIVLGSLTATTGCELSPLLESIGGQYVQPSYPEPADIPVSEDVYNPSVIEDVYSP